MLRIVPLLLVVVLGCTPPPAPPPEVEGLDGNQVSEAAKAEGKKLLLASEPAGAKGVKAVKQYAKDGDEVVIVGRVGGHVKPFTKGRAAFLIVDPSLKPSTECDCPWDYCDYEKVDLDPARANVKFVATDGKTLPADAKATFGIKELTTVVVKGKATRDDQGNLTVVGTGIFVRKE